MTLNREHRDAPVAEVADLASLLELAARRAPDDVALVGEQTRWTWADVERRSRGVAGRLIAAGVGPGDRVAVARPKGPESFEAVHAVLRAGAVVVPVDAAAPASVAGDVLSDAGPVAVLGDAATVAKLSVWDALPDLRVVIATGSADDERVVPWEAAANGDAPVELPRVAPADPAYIIYTSGTTGRPKGVMYTHRGTLLNALGEIVVHGLDRDSVFLWTLPLFHCNGWCFPWAVAGVGGTHVMLRGVDPAEILRLIPAEGVTHFNGAPTVLLMLAEAPEAAGVRFDPAIRVATGGAPPSPTLLARMEELGVRVIHLYGLTETYGPHVYCEPQPGVEDAAVAERARFLARQGVPYHTATHLRVVDEAMNDVPADAATMGEVVMRGNNVMKGYYEDPEATAEAFRGGWFHSGDLGVVHADGYIELRDRKKDIIISGGENISTIEVEHTVVKHPAVLECAVVSMPHEKWGEVPKAFVSLKPGASLDEAELIAFCREHLAHFKCPKQVEFGDLPKTSTGKIQKFRLREKEWAGHDSRIQGS